MESTIKKLHQLQLMALNNNRVSVDINFFNTPHCGEFWTFDISYWHSHDIKSRISVNSYDTNADHRIDMMLKHRILEK